MCVCIEMCVCVCSGATYRAIIIIIIIIIKGHSIRRACLQPATNTQNSKHRPPTTNARSKGKVENKIKHCSEPNKLKHLLCLSLFVCRGRRYALQEWQAFYYYYYFPSHTPYYVSAICVRALRSCQATTLACSSPWTALRDAPWAHLCNSSCHCCPLPMHPARSRSGHPRGLPGGLLLRRRTW